MSSTKAQAPVQLTSTVFPTADDVVLWQSLTAEERLAMLDADLEEARTSGIGTKTMDDLWLEAERVAAGSRENAL